MLASVGETQVIMIIIAVMFVGAIVQTIAGMGFGMLVVPVTVLLFGPAEGVIWGNFAGFFASLTATFFRWQQVEWRKTALLFLGSVPAVILTTIGLNFVSIKLLDLLIGTLTAVMVVFSVFALRFPPVTGSAAVVGTGFISGILSVSVAQSGPVMAAYAQASRWQQSLFAATIQPYFVALNLIVIPLKMYSGLGSHITHLTVPTVLAGVSAIIAGALFSRWAGRYVSAGFARSVALAVAGAGALMILYRGIMSFL